ncbi:MAG: single-stranded-DNA-specific exonuclease RecJ [Pseudomonadota bacterium]
MGSPVLRSRSLDSSLPLIERLYRARNASPVERDLSLKRLLSPEELPDIDRAADRLARAVVDDEGIVIVGDFDADGATSVALAVTVLEAFGASRVRYLVPDRFRFGYGLSPAIAELALATNPAVLVTVDNGVSSVEGVTRVQDAGVDVLVTDHHLPGDELPPAYAIVNPVLDGARFGSRALAGVGVIYYTLLKTRQLLRTRGWFDADRGRPEPNLAEVLDLVALGTVADVVPLDFNNRVLVAQGLKRIRAGRCRPGITALLELAKRDPSQVQASDLGYAVGPRLNAAGRLDDMSIGIQCLLATDAREARETAERLDLLNRERRALQQSMVAAAEQHADAVTADPAVVGVCVYQADWHQGIVGLVAGRLKDRLHRPVVAFAPAGDESRNGAVTLKGSARSIEGLHIRDLLDGIAARHPGLIHKFGGHAMAAGLEISERHLKSFAHAFDQAARTHVGDESLVQTVLTDGPLPAAERSLDAAQAIRAAGPWGQGFPEPLFQGRFEVLSERIVGEHHLKLVLRDGQQVLDAIAFNTRPTSAPVVEVAYRLSENAYRGAVTLQLIVEHLEALPTVA